MNLFMYYKFNHTVQRHHNWSEDRINNQYPWERDMFIMFINQDIEKEEKRNG